MRVCRVSTALCFELNWRSVQLICGSSSPTPHRLTAVVATACEVNECGGSEVHLIDNINMNVVSFFCSTYILCESILSLITIVDTIANS